MTATEIVDACILALYDNTTTPVLMSREEVLAHINHAYTELMAEALNIQTSATITPTDGVGDLPTGYVAPLRVYDGTTKLDQIFDIDEKVADTDATSQYWIPNETQIYLFGKTPTGTITMYHKAKPTALTESPSTSPTSLKGRFHEVAFTTYIKMIRAKRLDNLQDYHVLWADWLDILDDIEASHNVGREDSTPDTIKGEW